MEIILVKVRGHSLFIGEQNIIDILYNMYIRSIFNNDG